MNNIYIVKTVLSLCTSVFVEFLGHRVFPGPTGLGNFVIQQVFKGQITTIKRWFRAWPFVRAKVKGLTPETFSSLGFYDGNGPFAAKRSRGTKFPNWRANDALGHVKQSHQIWIFLFNISLISYPDLTLSLEMWDLVKFDFEHAQCQRGPKYGLFFHCACSYSLLWFWVILRNKHGFREYSWRGSFG